MRWKVTTEKNSYVVSATSSKIAVEKVRKKDSTKILGASLMPVNTVDKLKKKWRGWFGN